MNYLQPAGASLVHPHMQMLVTPVPYSYHARLLSACRAYRAGRGTTYFDDLVGEEKKIGERYIAGKGNWHWIAAFSPLGSNEIMAVHAEEQDFAALSEEDVQDLSGGISTVLAFYEGSGTCASTLPSSLRGETRLPGGSAASSRSSPARTSAPRTGTTTTSSRSCSRRN